MSRATPTILRPGMISAAAISEVLGSDVVSARQDAPAIRAPGMHHLHYAPSTETVLVATKNIVGYLQNVKHENEAAALLMHSNLILPPVKNIHIIKMPDHPHAYAHDLYQALRMADNHRFNQIIIESVPNDPAWEAIQDRLSKASSKR